MKIQVENTEFCVWQRRH